MRVLLICLAALLTIFHAIQSFAAEGEQITNYVWSTTGQKIHGWKELVFKTDGWLEIKCHPGDPERGTWKESGKGVVQVQVPGDEYLSDATFWFSGDASGYTRLDLWDNKSRVGGSGNRREALNAAAASQPPPASAGGAVPWVAVFAGQLPNAMGWATLPLSNTVPTEIRNKVAELQGGLQNEAAKAPQASAQAYASADLICRCLLYDLNDRENTLQQNRQNAAGKLSEAWMNAWAVKSARYRSVLQADIEQFITAVRRSEKPKQPVPAGMVASVDLPPVPAAAGAPASDFKPDQNNPLNRGAYDRHPVWWAPWWGYYHY